MRNILVMLVVLALAVGGVALFKRGSTDASSPRRVRITTQFGLSYLPLAVMQDRKLVEQHAAKAGLHDVAVEWVTLGNGSAASDALLSENASFVAVGVPQLVTLWDKSAGDVRGIAAINNAPLYLNTTKASIQKLSDFSDADRIALPASKVSVQAIVLQMAAAKAFGDVQFSKLDKLTVSMKHPDGMAALLAGQAEIDAHFSSSPFQEIELKDARVHRVVNSYDVFGGPHTHIVLIGSRTFHDANPKLCAALVEAIEEADALIAKDPVGAIESYRRVSKTGESVDDVARELKSSGIEYTTTPAKIGQFAEFMARTGTVKTKPASWKDMFFSEAQGHPGS